MITQRDIDDLKQNIDQDTRELDRLRSDQHRLENDSNRAERAFTEAKDKLDQNVRKQQEIEQKLTDYRNQFETMHKELERNLRTLSR